MYVSDKVNELKWRQSVKQAERIINALSEYRNENGEYPESLGVLIPEYLERIPKTKVAFFNHRGFYYSRKTDTDEYVLGFAYVAWTLSEYSSATEEWTIED